MVILIVISFALEAFIIELYCRKSFTAKVRLDKRLIVYTVIYGVLTALYSEEVFFRNVLLEVIAGAFIMYFLFENSVISAIKNSIILMIVNNASKILVGEISAHIDDGFLYGDISYKNYIIMLAAEFIYMGIVMFLIHIQKKSPEKTVKTKAEECLTTVILACAMGLICIMVGMIYAVDSHKPIEWLLMCAILVLLTALVLSAILIKCIKKENAEYIHEQKRKTDKLYIGSIRRKDEGLEFFTNEIKNNLETLAALNERGESEKVTKYIDELFRKSNLKATVDISSDKLLSAVIYRYYNEALSRNIKFTYDVRNVDIGKIEEIDITSILCDLLDNAMKVCDHENPFIEITIHEGQPAGTIVISVACSSEKEQLMESREYVSTNIKKTVKKYNGDINIYFQDEDKTLHITVILYEDIIENENTNMR